MCVSIYIVLNYIFELGSTYYILQNAWDDSQRLTKWRLEREQGHHDASNDLPELFEGEKEKGDADQTKPIKEKITRINFDMQLWSVDDKSKGLYIILDKVHGHLL